MSERFNPMSARSRSSRARSWRSAWLRDTKFTTLLETLLRKSGMMAEPWVVATRCVVLDMLSSPYSSHFPNWPDGRPGLRDQFQLCIAHAGTVTASVPFPPRPIVTSRNQNRCGVADQSEWYRSRGGHFLQFRSMLAM
jgi:hypothetical protein